MSKKISRTRFLLKDSGRTLAPPGGCSRYWTMEFILTWICMIYISTGNKHTIRYWLVFCWKTLGGLLHHLVAVAVIVAARWRHERSHVQLLGKRHVRWDLFMVASGMLKALKGKYRGSVSDTYVKIWQPRNRRIEVSREWKINWDTVLLASGMLKALKGNYRGPGSNLYNTDMQTFNSCTIWLDICHYMVIQKAMITCPKNKQS